MTLGKYTGTLMAMSLQSQKQQLVRDAIYDAAIELFAENGFDEVTVEEIAQAAGVSRRTFFRYFESKDDLLAQNVVNYGRSLSAAIRGCPKGASPLETIRETVLAIAKEVAAVPRIRQIIQIAQRSASARQAYRSRMTDAEDAVSEAFASRFRNTSKDDLKARLFAGLTFSMMNSAILSWYHGEYQDIALATRQALNLLTRMFGEDMLASESEQAPGTSRRTASSLARKSKR